MADNHIATETSKPAAPGRGLVAVHNHYMQSPELPAARGQQGRTLVEINMRLSYQKYHVVINQL